MKSSIFVPMIGCVVLFAVVYHVQATANTTTDDHSKTPVDYSTVKRMSGAEAKTFVLDGWPQKRRDWMSRAAPRYVIYATAECESNWEQDQDYFLCSLNVMVNNWEKFPVMVDRINQTGFIFFEGEWHDYSEWKKTHIGRMTGAAESNELARKRKR